MIIESKMADSKKLVWGRALTSIAAALLLAGCGEIEVTQPGMDAGTTSTEPGTTSTGTNTTSTGTSTTSTSTTSTTTDTGTTSTGTGGTGTTSTTSTGTGSGTGGSAPVPSCSDAVKNQDETDVDCGGSCDACADGMACAVAADCQSGVCTGNVCQVPSCTDGVENGTESDLDCGGDCAPCAYGGACAVDSDCASGVCNAGACERTIVAVSGGGYHFCAVSAKGELKCWGRNTTGQLGLGDTQSRGDGANEMGSNLPIVDLGAGRTVKSVSAGVSYTCAILDDDSLKCWGLNESGQLGLGDNVTRGDAANEMGDNLPSVSLGTGRTAKAVFAGEHHACAILDDGSLKCWGANGNGQLGLGDTVARGDGPNEMGDNLPAIDLGAGRTAKWVGLGNSSTCAILDDDSIKCWGSNGSGHLGLGDKNARGDGPNEMGDNLPAVDLGAGRKATAMTVGYAHVCALLDDATVKCWGYNGDGRLGLGDLVNRGEGPNQMGDDLPAIALGTGRTAVMLTGGANSACAILDDATMKCWGWGNNGVLGTGDTQMRGDTISDMGDDLLPVSLGTGRTVERFDGAWFSSCALLDDDTMKCWGHNNNGQLGQGDTKSRGDDPGEMGDALPVVSL